MRWHKTNDAQHYATVPLFLIDVAVQLLPHRSTLNQRAVCNMVILLHGQVLRADFRHGWRLLRQPQSLFQHGVTSLGRVTLFHDMIYIDLDRFIFSIDILPDQFWIFLQISRKRVKIFLYIS